MRSKILFAVALLFVLSGCKTRLVDFTIISTKNFDLQKASTYKVSKQRVEGVDRMHMILIIPTGTINLEEAIDNCLKKVPGAVALIDGVVYYSGFSVLVYGQSSYIVEGTPLIDPTVAEQGGSMPEYSMVYLDKNGNTIESKELSQQEYESQKAKMEIKQNVQ